MSEVILTDYQSALRAAHEQVQTLEHVYREEDRDAEDRLAELTDYREALLAELRRENLLPTEPDPERESLQRLLGQFKDALTEDKGTVITGAERDLDELGRQLEQCDVSLPDGIARGIRRTREVVGQLG